MKLSYVRHSMLLALALTLAACGGKANFPISGTVIGLQYEGLVMSNNDTTELSVPAGAITFSFPNGIDYGTAYNVKVKKDPLHQTCQWTNGTDTAGRQASINVVVQCSLVPHAIGGTVTGLTGDGLVLINGKDDQIAVTKDKTTFVFGGQIAFNTSYGVSVLTQPAGQKCTVANGTGLMGDIDITTIALTCVAI